MMECGDVTGRSEGMDSPSSTGVSVEQGVGVLGREQSALYL